MSIEERLIKIRKQVSKVLIEVEPVYLGVREFKLHLYYKWTHKHTLRGETIEKAVIDAEAWLVESEHWRKV